MPHHLNVLTKVVSKNRKRLIDDMGDVLKLDLTLETYKYKNGLELKLLVIKKAQRVRDKISKFFSLAARNLKGELADVFLVSPKQLDNLCKLG